MKEFDRKQEPHLFVVGQIILDCLVTSCFGSKFMFSPC